MILFCGIPSEPPLALAIEAAERHGLEHVVFNQRHAAACDIVVDLERGRLSGVLLAWGKEWPLESFTGAYTRLIEASTLPERQPLRGRQPDPFTVGRVDFLHDVLRQWLEAAPCRVLNRAAAMASNGSKPYQAQIIRRAGFRIPATLVTNSAADALEFIAAHQRVIYKSISSIRSIVREWKPEDRPRLEQLRCLPTQFQAYVPGVNIRVHVVGRKVFATEIRSSALDYRYAQEGESNGMCPAKLPSAVRDRCRELAKRLSLPFCGIDLKRTPQGEYFCFEVNPSPAYSYFQEHTGQPIAVAVVKYLAGIAN